MMIRQSILAFLLTFQAVSGYAALSAVSSSRRGWISSDFLQQQNMHHLSSPVTRQVSCSMAGDSSSGPAKEGDKKKKKEVPLTPEKAAELIEVSFVNGVMQLAQGYVDVLKLFVAAVESGYALGLTSGNLLDTVTDCPEQSAGRELVPEELTLRNTWIQVVYLVLDHVQYKEMNLGDLKLVNQRAGGVDAMDSSVQETFAAAIPILVKAHDEANGSFDAENVLELCESVVPEGAMDDPLKKAIFAQSLRVIWLTLTVLQEEAQCLEDKPYKPQPQIPGAFKD